MRGIYRICNTLDNKCYIGQSINIERRWAEHIYKAKHTTITEKNKLYFAIYQNKLENFEFSIVEECSMEVSLDEREIYWINYYNSFIDGYNSTKGGQGSNIRTVDENLIYQLWDDGLSSKEIQYITDYSKATIYHYLKNYKNYSPDESRMRGYKQHLDIIEKVNKDALYKFVNRKWETLCHPIHQYDLFGKYIQSFDSITEAEKYFNTTIGDSSIRKYLNGHGCKTALGYQWNRDKVDTMPVVSRPRAKIVKCLNTLELFPCAKDASEKYNIPRSSITNCCNKQTTYAGYHPITKEPMKWEYV